MPKIFSQNKAANYPRAGNSRVFQGHLSPNEPGSGIPGCSESVVQNPFIMNAARFANAAVELGGEELVGSGFENEIPEADFSDPKSLNAREGR
jgi:hypothetical protein